MALTPEEIVSYDLKQAVRGYAISQVDDLLDQLADQVEAEQLERERLAAQLREAEHRLEASQETESMLKRTLVTAQEAAERSLQEARDEAEELLDRAREQARTLEEEAQRESARVLDEARGMATREAEEARSRRAALQERVDDLIERERAHRTRLRELLERQLRELEQLEASGDPGADVAAGEAAADDAVVDDGFAGFAHAAEPAGEHHEEHPPESHGLRVRAHEHAGDPPSDSPLGSQPLRDED